MSKEETPKGPRPLLGQIYEASMMCEITHGKLRDMLSEPKEPELSFIEDLYNPKDKE